MLKKIIFAVIIALYGAANAATPAIPPGPYYNPNNVQFVVCQNNNDQVAINNALIAQNAGTAGPVMALRTCDIQSSVLMLTNTELMGAGPGSTILRLHAGTAYSNSSNVISAIASNTADLTNFKVSDLTTDGNTANQSDMIYGQGNASIAVTIPYVVTGGTNDTLTFVINGGGTSTATLTAGTYSTLQSLVAMLNTRVLAANSGANVLQFGGVLSLLSNTGTPPSVTVASIGGNAAAGLFGTPTYVSGVTDNAYNGIVVRGNPDNIHKARKFTVENVEMINSGFHGIAVYDGASEFSIRNNNSHNNNFRCIHVHALASGSVQPTTRFDVTGNRCHDDGQGIVLPNTAGTGMFAFFDGTQDAIISDNQIWNEPDHSFDIVGAADGATNPTQYLTVANNKVSYSGTGLYFQAGVGALKGVTINGNSAHDISYSFIEGSAAAGLTITTGTNDTLAVNLAGNSQNVVIPGSVYGSASALATAIQTAVNTAYAATGSAITVTAPSTPSGFIYAVPIFTNGKINNAFSFAAPGSQSAYTTVFGSSPVQYGGYRTGTLGICEEIIATNVASTISDVSVTGGNLNNCASWGLVESGFSSSVLATRIATSGLTINQAGMDSTIPSGGAQLTTINDSAFTGNVVTNSNVASSAGRQLYLAANASNNSITGNVLDTVSTTQGISLETATTANYNVITGNMINRQNGTSNQFNNTGTGNIVCNNIQGSSNAGTVIGTTPCGTLTGTTGSIGGGALLAGACTSGTVAVTNAATNMAVQVSPNTYPGDGIYETAYVSPAGTVIVKVCAAIAATPTAGTYNVRVIQ